MEAFRNILVGIDIDAKGELAAGSCSALEQALQLARKTQATLTLMHVIHIVDNRYEVMSEQPAITAELKQQATALLQTLAAQGSGLDIKTKVVEGLHWRELILEVLRANHDLVIVGTRGRGVAGRALFGSTGNRLLRNCPCPVWSIKPMDKDRFDNLLVAHDLTEVGQRALSLAAGIAKLQGTRLHVLHVMEHPETKRFLGHIAEEEVSRREQVARAAIEEQCKALKLDNPAGITVVSGDAYTEILSYARQNDVDLLCMGTVARSGLAGLITGNTAENVLPWVTCSLIAIKPEGFVSPLAQN